jgi:uncharacterized protein YjdB
MSLATVGAAQQRVTARLVAQPATLSMQVGQTVPLTITAYDAAGAVIPDAQVRVTGPRRSVSYDDGKLTAISVGRHEVTASSVAVPPNAPVSITIPVTVTWAPLSAQIVLRSEHCTPA